MSQRHVRRIIGVMLMLIGAMIVMYGLFGPVPSLGAPDCAHCTDVVIDNLAVVFR